MSSPTRATARLFDDISDKLTRYPESFRVFQIGFSLYERAWDATGHGNADDGLLRQSPFSFTSCLRLLPTTTSRKWHHALAYDIDAIYFGDDWGQQCGLQMGPAIWREFIYPQLKRMYAVVRDAGKFVMIHSCGDVDELFDDLIDAGLDCFNPFQPEVMEVAELLPRYRGRLAFHGGLSTQKTLPFGSVDQVRAETWRMLELGGRRRVRLGAGARRRRRRAAGEHSGHR